MSGRAALTRRARATAQLLGPRVDRSPEDIVAHLLAVQAQDLRSARLALRARGTGFDAADVDAALAAGSLVVTWLLRGTLHLVTAADWPWLQGLFAPRGHAATERRLAQLGVTEAQAARAVQVVRDRVADGPCERAELAAAMAAEGVPVAGQRTPHLLRKAALDGVIVGCGEARFTAAPPLGDGLTRDDALARLGARYLRGHGPADAADLATWTGLGVRDARRALAAAERLDPAGAACAAPLAARLLPAFDPYLLGWRDRSFAVPAALATEVHPGGGLLRAVRITDGVVDGTWSLTAIPADAEGRDVQRFLGLCRSLG